MQLAQLSVATLFITYRWKESEMSTPDVSNLLPLEDDMMVYFFALNFPNFSVKREKAPEPGDLESSLGLPTGGP